MVNFYRVDKYLFIGIFLFSIHCFGQKKACAPEFAQIDHDINNLASFWENDSPVEIAFANGKKEALTFSFDSEITLEDTFRFLLQDPIALKELETIFNIPRVSFDKSVLLRELKMSEQQFDRFVLRKGIDKNKNSFSITDLNPSFFNYVATHFGDNSHFVPYQTLPSFENAIKRKNLPYSVHLDVFNLEITHESWETKPKSFQDLIVNKLHKAFKSPQTHLHIGIPAEISDNKVRAIARAVETRIILRLAEDWVPNSAKLRYTDYSSLRTIQRGNRGVIRLGVEEWTKPVSMHNLEIRQWSEIADGLGNLALAARLAENYKKLKYEMPEFSLKSTTIHDDFTSNLHGALKYAGFYLAQSKDAENIRIAKKLLAFAEQIENKNEITDSTRAEVSDFLKFNEVIERLNIEVFLDKE